MLHLFAVNDRPREALGVHPPVPHVVGADGGKVGHHTATAGPVLRQGFPFLLFHVHFSRLTMPFATSRLDMRSPSLGTTRPALSHLAPYHSAKRINAPRG